jgi:hypothetical protein
MQASNPKGKPMFLEEHPAALVNQPSAKPTRKLQFGIWGGVLVAAVIAGLTAYDIDLAATWVPVITAIAGSLGVAVPAYIAKNRAP